MVLRHVEVKRDVAAEAKALWSIVRNFSAPWHPLITKMTAERGGAGEHIRRFTVKGDTTVYREQLIYFSDADHVMTYRMIEGIKEANNYIATLSIVPDATGCAIHWQASIDAEEPRVTHIAEGTRAIFEQGCDSLAALCSPRVETQYVDGDGPRLCIDHCGVQTEALCLFLHGIGGGRQNWAAQITVAGRFMQVAALDLRGYGQSALGGNASIVDDYCDDILRVMRHMNTKRVVLCGLSYGAWIATSFAMRHPSMLAGLVLAGGCTGMSEALPEERERFRLAREVPLDAGLAPRDFADQVVKVIASPQASDAVKQQLHDSMSAIPALTYRDALRCFTQPTEIFDFSKLNCPVLFLTGQHDVLAPPHEIRAVAQRVVHQAKAANVRFEIVAGAGHVCNVEAPDVFNTLLQSFLADLAP